MTFILLIVEYFGWQGPFHQVISPQLALSGSRHDMTFYAQIYTTLSFLTFFLFIPLLFYKTLARDLPIEGLKVPSIEGLLPYLFFAGLMFMALLIVCQDPSFYNFYPLYRPQDLKQWFLFELVYLPQFIAVEFFFRGPLLFSLKRDFNRHAIMIMTMAYALIHIHKPFPEALGSIGAGIILCHYSLKSKSVWFGVVLHMFVALTADGLGLFYSGSMARW